MNRKTIATYNKNEAAVFDIVSEELTDKSLVYMVLVHLFSPDKIGRQWITDALEIHCISLAAAANLVEALKNVVEIQLLKKPTQKLPESFEVNPGRGRNGFAESMR